MKYKAAERLNTQVNYKYLKIIRTGPICKTSSQLAKSALGL